MGGRFRTDDQYTLKSMVPIVPQEQPAELQEMMKSMAKAEMEGRPYELINGTDEEEITVNIKVPASTEKKDVKVKITSTTIRVEVKGHECQPCVVDGTLFRPVDTDCCDYHLEGSGDKRLLVLDLMKAQNGLKWPELLNLSGF